MTLGSPIAMGNTGHIYRQGDRVIKVLRGDLPDSETEREAAKQRYAHACGLPVPEVYEIISVNGRPAIVMEHIEGPTLGDVLMADRSRCGEFMALSADIQLKIHACKAEGIEPMEEKLCRQIMSAGRLDRSLRESLCGDIAAMDYERRLCHGDFHVFNLILTEEGAAVIDWVDAVAGDIKADVCRTYMMYRGFSADFAELYLSLYLKKSGLKRAEVLSWAPYVAAARLSEGPASAEGIRLMAIAAGELIL